MILKGIQFSSVQWASGAMGFFGEGYKYHQYLRVLCPGFNTSGVGFVAKTTPIRPRPGNLPFKEGDFAPVEFWPKCIVVNLQKGAVLNAVDLSSPGACALFETGRWQSRTDNFFLSFAAVGQTPAERLEELRKYVNLLLKYQKGFRGKIGLQINYSCVNTGVEFGDPVDEINRGLDLAGHLGIPLVPKFNILTSVGVVREIAKHRHCDAICLSNTVPWGSFPDKINWRDLFGQDESPLAQYGGGGLSGAPLRPLVLEWLHRANGYLKKPICAGGGIMGPQDVRLFCQAPGVAAVSLGSIMMLRPWKVTASIQESGRLL